MGDDVRDLSRQARDVERCAIDDFDPHHALGRNPSKRCLRIVRLAGHPAAVDEHVLLRLAETALVLVFIVAVDAETRNVADHVCGGLRCEAREVGGLVNLGLGYRLRWGSRRLRDRGGRNSQRHDPARNRKRARVTEKSRTSACAAGAYLTCRQCSSPDLDGFYGDADPSDRGSDSVR